MRRSARNVRELALTSLFVALGVVILYLGSFFEVIDLAVAAVASFPIVITVIEMGKGRAGVIWLATSLLALLLLPNKLIAAEYALLMGCYPLVKAFAERFPRVLSWVVKLVFALLSTAVLVLLSHYIFAMPYEAPIMMVVLFLLALFACIVYDIALTQLLTLYLVRLRKMLKIDRLLK